LDIDERRHVQDALQKSEADLRAVFNSSARGFILAGRNGKIRDFNQLAFESVRRMRGQELEMGRSLVDYVEPEFVKVFKERFKKILQGETLHLERVVKSPSGTEEWFEFTYNPVWDDQGKVIGVCAAIGSIQRRKDAEAAIQKSESNLRAIFNSSTQGLTVVDREGVVQFFNQAASNFMKEYRGQELQIGKPMTEGLVPEMRESFQGLLRRTLGGETVRGEGQYRFHDGSLRWFEYTYNPVLDGEGVVTGICLTSLSIDGRKRAEEDLKDSEEKFRKVFENASLGMTLVDKEFRFLHVNHAFCEMVGYLPEELVGRKFAEFTHPDDMAKNLSFSGDVLQGKGFRMQKRYLHKDGRVIWANLTVQSFLNTRGEFLYSLGMVEDVTERRHAEEALRDSEEKFRRIFEDASMAMAMINEYKFLRVNKAFQKLMGYSEQEIIGKTLFELTHPEDLGATRQIADKMHSQETDHFQMEKRYLKKSGENLWAQVSGTLIRNGRGEKMYSLVMIQDITERKKVQEALQKSEADLKAVFNSGSQVVVLIGPDGNVQNFNPSADFMAKRVLGRGMEKGIPFIKTLPPGADPEIFKASFQAALEGKESQGEWCIRSAEGKERWVEVKYQPVVGGHGEVQGVCFSLSFIDERKRAEEALRESQERFQRFTELTREGILIHENPRVADVNPALAAMMGYGAEEMIGKSGFDFLAPESREEARRRMQEGSAAPYEVLALRKDGTTFPVELQGLNYLDKGRTFRVMTVRDLTWQKAAERILTESEERYRKLVELLPEAIVVHAAGRVLYVNSAGLKMFAASPEEVEGSTLADFLHPDHRQEALSRVQEILQTGRPTEWIEQKLVRKDGGLFDAETKGTPILYQGIPAIMTIVRDITERKKAETALRESEKDYRRLVAEIPLAMVVMDERGVVVSANAESARMLGAPQIGDLIGRSLYDFILPENEEAVRKRVEKVLVERVETKNRETELRTLNGQRVQVEVRGIPVTFQGRKLGLSIMRDVTESKKVERTLRESEQLYRHLVASIPLAIMVVGDGMRIVSANVEAAKLFKATRPEDLVGKTALDFVLPENREIVGKRLTATLREGADGPARETELLALNGERIHVEASGIPFTYQGRQCALSIFRDIAESKRINQMLLRYERLAAVGKVIAAIAHEVRNPLAVVSGMSQILKSKLETRLEYSQELDTILTQAGRLKFFMNDILDYSRSMEIHKAPVNPRILMEESLLLAQAQLASAQTLTHVEWRMEPGLPDFLADGDRLQQVLVNLVLNAYQALDGKGTIVLSARTKDGWMMLGVEDDGPGIPEADMTRLFEPFFTTKKQGSGLGLSISQKIAEAHGGRIAMKRLSPHGSYFALQLPLEKAE
ncbi:MAG TPA: PAS domain S-box protein, partial [bacterium]|nr:PAS domain S-box protein [bacterium]